MPTGRVSPWRGDDCLGGRAWWITAGDRSVLASRGSKGGGSYRRDGGFTCPGMASGVTRRPMWGVGHTMTMCLLRTSPPSKGMCSGKGFHKRMEWKVVSFEMVVCCLLFTTLALVHFAYFIFQSLAWVGKEDGSYLLSLFAHPTLYIPFQVQVDTKDRLGAEACFPFIYV